MDWTYKSGANGSTTALISTYTNGSDARYNYNYDANGNITQIWRGSVTFANASEKYSYVYDEANQLIRENLCYGTGNSNNATITYEYDSWGNLLNKKIYAYTTGTLSEIYRENPSRCMCFFLIHAAKRPSAVLIHCNKLIVEALPMIDTSTPCFIPYSSRR